jgi:hypothetical protein
VSWDEIQERADRDNFSSLGRPGTYRRSSGGDPIATTVVLEKGLAQFPSEGEPLVSGPLDVVSILAADVPPPYDRDDEIEISGITYYVDGRLADDTFIAALQVRESMPLS